MATARTDQDSAWKDVLRQYFPEAIAFFFPQTAAKIDWERPHEFLDQEFRQIAPEAEVGKRYTDQLVRVWLKQGEEAWLLLHVEVQAKREAKFSERMFVYHIKIFERFGRHATGLAILCDGNANWRPDAYRVSQPDLELLFRFGQVKLLDYRDRWDELEQSSNPFAVVVMAHLKAQETRKNLQSRKDWKFSLIRRLYERGYDRRDVINLFRFIDWVMILPEGLKRQFLQELRTYEEGQRMPYISSIERMALEQGLEQGLERERSLILRLLTRKVGEMPKAVRSQLKALSIDQLESLGEALLDFTSLADLEQWLTENR